MWKPLIRCSIVGGVIVFLWFMISWMVFPMHKMSMHKFTNESEVTSCILRSAPKDGIYVIPFMEEQKTAQTQEADQPFIFVNIARGIDFKDMTRPMVISIITQVIGAFLITYLLLRAKAMKYWSRVWFVTIIGVVVALLGTVPAWNWWHFSTGWALLEIFDIVIGWFIGGLIIGKLIKN